MTNVIPIPALTDNYIWIIVNPSSRHCVLFDPGAATPVLNFLNQHNLILDDIFVTHHHADHTGGITQIQKHYPVKIHSAANAQAGEIITLENLQLELQVITTPGHTHDHLAYYGHEMLFCGDALFGASCGCVFEGTMAEMFSSLNKLKTLPETTAVYCSHEYTLENLEFAQIIEPHNQAIQQRITECRKLRKQNLPTLPSTIGLEKATNPFLRCDVTAVIAAACKHSHQNALTETQVFTIIRAWKDNWVK